MNLAAIVARVLIVMLLGLGCAGCWNNGPSTLDEEKDPYLLKGRSLVAVKDYTGAAEAFEKTLQANPRNAEALFELLVVNAQKLNDYATAIYYGNRFGKLKPNDSRMISVTQMVQNCKIALSKDCVPAPVPTDLINKFEKMSKENKSLLATVEQLKQRLFYAERQIAATASSISNAPPVPSTRMGNAQSDPPPMAVLSAATLGEPIKSKQFKTYVIKSRDTLGRISRDYNVSVAALTEANPGLNPKKIKAGQTINIPVR